MSADLLAAHPLKAARSLLGAVVSTGGPAARVVARIVEVEAYGGRPRGPWPDPAAHSYRGLTARNAVMFGPPGRLYTYRSHGIHICANVSCGTEGEGAAVLLRAAVIESGEDIARTRRGPSPAPFALARGPGNLCSAMAIAMVHNGIDIFAEDSPVLIRLSDPGEHLSGPRVGVSRAADRPWRLWLPGHPEVSAYRRSPRAPAPGASD